jgi:hypothetical protein
MTPGKSKILVADFVMPEIDPPRYRSAPDIMMAVLQGGAERTEAQWRRLLGRTDKKLKLEKIWAHPLGKSLCFKFLWNELIIKDLSEFLREIVYNLREESHFLNRWISPAVQNHDLSNKKTIC